MVQKFFKKRSKRISCRKRYKIERKVKEHNRKLRKGEKKTSNKNKQKKDPGVPNSCPFKDEILKEANERKQRLEEERQKQVAKRKKARQTMLAKKRNLHSIVADAQKRTEDFNKKSAFVAEKSKEYTGGKAVETSLKAYYKEFNKVVNAADVILEVLDARDPQGSRCPQVEEAVLSSGANKKIVLLLNKIDLVPKENVENWLKYLRNEFPTVAFKASTQTQKDHLAHSKVPFSSAQGGLLRSSKCLGAEMLMKLLGNYCRNQDMRTSITVGVVGFPNTGKSSIINSLKRSKACGVGATPGFTKTMQEIQLDKHVKLLDSPGIVMATGNSDSAIILKNCVKVEAIDDPVPAVSAILKRCNKHQMMLHYNISDFSDVHEFLALLAKRLGRLKKGGVPDVVKAGKAVLQDWNRGNIKYYTHPPEQHTMSSHLSAGLVTKMSEAFDIDALLKDEKDTLKDLKLSSSEEMVLDPSDPTEGLAEEKEEMSEDDDDDGDMDMDPKEEEEELSSVTVPVTRSRSSNSSSSSSLAEKTKKKKKTEPTAELEGNEQLNKLRLKEYKKMKKNRKRSEVLGGQLSDALTGALAGLGAGHNEADDYDFSVDFK